jgi:electron transfer flavoprotein beta subunit
MKFVVIVKEVPDTETQIVLRDGVPDLSSAALVINPYDEYAIEEALRQAEKVPGSTTTAVLIGSESSRKNLTNVLALGIDDAVLISDPVLHSASGPGCDGLQLAQVLKAAIAPLAPDVILAGRQGVDYDWGLTGIALAQLLDIAHVGLVSKLEINGGTFRTESEGDDGTQITEGALPALFTADKGLNEPRYANLKGIMAAKKKTVTEHNLASLGLDAAQLGAANGAVLLMGSEFPPRRQGGRIIEGATVQEQVAKLVDLLRNEAKAI